jgi:dTDP-4-dehydrorhamnose reductase
MTSNRLFDTKKIFILGDGLLGNEIFKQTDWKCFSRKLNNFNINKIEQSLKDFDIDIIINCIAHTDTYSKDKETHWNINCKFLQNLITFCNKKSIKLVHISTDYLYSGSINNASEEDVPVHCSNWYGYTKLIGDALVQLQSNDYLLIRCTHKPTPFPYDTAWINQIGNFDYVNIIADLIIKLINSGTSGLYNVGTEIKTMHELAKSTNTIATKSFAPSYVPLNTSMNIDKLKNIIKQ